MPNFSRIINKLLRKKISPAEVKRLERIQHDFPKVMTTTETLNQIILNKASLCRFGDAEFGISTFEQEDDPYQKPSLRLTNRLKEVLHTPTTKDLIVAIPPFNSKYNNIQNYYKNISFWQWYWLTRYDKLAPDFKNKLYGNSFVSRDEVFYENKLSEIKQIWYKREVVFVVSKKGRFVFDERLFDNIKSKEIIDISPTNTFDDYDNLLKKSLTFSKNKLFLIAAGPTATVLAYDLHNKGYQAIDIGHITNCYRQFLGEAKAPETLPMIGKER